MMIAIMFSCQNDTGSRVSMSTQYWGNIFVVVILILESKGLYYYTYGWIDKWARWNNSCVLIGYMSDKMGLSCLNQISWIGAEEKFFIFKSCLVKMAEYWPRSFFFFAFLLTLTKNSSRSLSH